MVLFLLSTSSLTSRLNPTSPRLPRPFLTLLPLSPLSLILHHPPLSPSPPSSLFPLSLPYSPSSLCPSSLPLLSLFPPPSLHIRRRTLHQRLLTQRLRKRLVKNSSKLLTIMITIPSDACFIIICSEGHSVVLLPTAGI